MHEQTPLKISPEVRDTFVARLAAKEMQDFIVATKAANDSDSGTFEVVISTADMDRQYEIVDQSGWELANYMANPVVLWAHDYYSLPIGLCESLSMENGKLVARGKFAPASANPYAQQVRQLYDLKMVRATSVGFIPKEFDGEKIIKAELLEFSFVPVPANPFALSLRAVKELGIDLGELATKGLTFSVKAEDEAEAAPAAEAAAESTTGAVGTEGEPAAAAAEKDGADDDMETGVDMDAMRNEIAGMQSSHLDDIMNCIGKYMAGMKTVKAAEGTEIKPKEAEPAAEADPVKPKEESAAADEVGDAGSNAEAERSEPQGSPAPEELKGFELFMEGRGALKEMSTILSDVLARQNKAFKEMRKSK